MKKSYIFLVSLICVLMVSGGVWYHKKVSHDREVQQTVTIGAGELPAVGQSVTKDGYTITNEGVPVKSVAPKYDRVPQRPPQVDAGTYGAVVERMQAEMHVIKEFESKRGGGFQEGAWLNLATYRNMLGDSDGAEEIWKYLIAVDPGLVQPYGNLAGLYAQKKRYSDAESYYHEAITRKPDNEQYYQDLAQVYTAQGKRSDAVRILREGANACGASWSLLVNLGRMYAEGGERVTANSVLEEAALRAEKAGNGAIAATIRAEKK